MTGRSRRETRSTWWWVARIAPRVAGPLVVVLVLYLIGSQGEDAAGALLLAFGVVLWVLRGGTVLVIARRGFLRNEYRPWGVPPRRRPGRRSG